MTNPTETGATATALSNPATPDARPAERRLGKSASARMANSIRHLERVTAGAWECSTRTDDGHAISGFGVTAKQAIYDAHRKARLYGVYRYPA